MAASRESSRGRPRRRPPPPASRPPPLPCLYHSQLDGPASRPDHPPGGSHRAKSRHRGRAPEVPVAPESGRTHPGRTHQQPAHHEEPRGSGPVQPQFLDGGRLARQRREPSNEIRLHASSGTFLQRHWRVPAARRRRTPGGRMRRGCRIPRCLAGIGGNTSRSLAATRSVPGSRVSANYPHRVAGLLAAMVRSQHPDPEGA